MTFLLQETISQMRTPKKHCDEVDLLYMLAPHNVNDLYVIVEGKVHCFCITNDLTGCNPIEPLITLCEILLDGVSGSIRFDDCTSTLLLIVRVDAKQRYLVEFSAYTSDRWSAKPEFSVTMKRSHLATLLFYKLCKTEMLCKEKSFAKIRETFPQDAFSRLIEKWEKAVTDGRL